ncbi:hypothetical protein DL546_007784 [Coniochaeta pulveracea]|uniref:Acyl-coenzyme A diphosphatase SCS3 n=1 Tax=Coniochaeta pulveracea TaxID=177199 RepID=A0A420YIX7_9PEZI|nr:hypothetical protein DL546_007784 [Coniochaeta pulveracea]
MTSPTPSTPNLRLRPSELSSPMENGSSTPSKPTSATTTRNSPYLPTPTERFFLALYPTLLLFGALFSLISPETRSAPFDKHTHAHTGPAPSYFARKDNLLNQVFVKRGWFWITLAFALWVFTHPALAAPRARLRAGARWATVTAFWVLITQWCFGPPIIDRGFRLSGGRCEVAVGKMEEGTAGGKDIFTAAACKAGGGRWAGGTDISGHVFMLVLGSAFLLAEVGWVVARWKGRRELEERTVVMGDGAVKGAGVEAGMGGVGRSGAQGAYGIGGRVVLGVVGLSLWMVLMTAIYFHTWFEKASGLAVAVGALYVTYVLPRWVPQVRQVLGMPGI